jgi:hypothetical protein
MLVDDRFGSLAPDATPRQDFPMSVLAPTALDFIASRRMTFSAMCGRLRVGKGFLHVSSIGRCSHVFGL